MLYYLSQVILFQLLFLGVYEIFLKKETFFNWNRFYLLLTSLLSLVIPFIQIKFMEKYIPPSLTIPVFLNSPSSSLLNSTSEEMHPTYTLSIENVYWIGVGVMGFFFLTKLIQLLYIIKTHKVVKKKKYNLIYISENKSAFSFFHYIFLPKSLDKSNDNLILKHELVHVKEKHSLDLLWFEFLKIILWFNPLSYIFQYKISLLHEYIADTKTIKQSNKKNYFENLILQTFQIEKIPFVNQYNKKSLIKNRIIMATKDNSKQISKMKYLISIPVLSCMLFIASCNNKKADETHHKKEEIQVPQNNIPEEKTSKSSQEFMMDSVDQLPVFPGCENETDKDAQKQCFTKNIQTFVSQNFDRSIAKKLNLSGQQVRILTMFTIDKNGKIKNVKARAKHKELMDEAIRVIKSMPLMKPGEKNGKKVDIVYMLPIIFKIEK